MQNTDPTFASGAMQLGLNCGSPSASNFPVVGNFGVSLPSGTWTKITGTVDLTATAGCDPTKTGGVVDSVALYLNQTGTEAPTAMPNLFIDDLVVTVTDGHNLIGNPNFESGTTAGWSSTGGTLAVSAAQAHGGTNSLIDTARTQTFQGPKWNLPIGAAKYNVVFFALHTGSVPRDSDPAAGVHLPGRVAAVPRVGRHRVAGRGGDLEPALRHCHLPARERAGGLQADLRGPLRPAGRLDLRNRGGAGRVPRYLCRRCLHHARALID